MYSKHVSASIAPRPSTLSLSDTVPRHALPCVSVIGAQQNALLKALSRSELERLFPALELVPLDAGKQLFGDGDKVDYAYFPTNAIVSLMAVTDEGATIEIAVIGREGAAGIAWHEAERASCSALVQTAGFAYRLKTSLLREMLADGGALGQLLVCYTSALFVQMAQSIVGANHSSLEQKFCRWLLDRLDRSISNELRVTQEAMARMLGVRRESVTGAASKLADAGVIACRRGSVTVLDRDELERCAGGCYRAARAGLEQLHGWAHN